MMRVAGLQMAVTADIAANARRILAGLDEAAARGAEIVLTPEGSLSGYTSRFDQRALVEAMGHVTARAAELHVGLALGTCYVEDGGGEGGKEGEGCCYNQVRVYAPDGHYQGFAAKTLRCAPLGAPASGEMSEYAAAPLRTFAIKGISFGCLICNDLWATPGYTATPNPFLAWQLSKMGAKFILHAVNSGGSLQYRPYHESNVELWARALKIPIAVANAVPESDVPNCRSGMVGADGQWAQRLEQPGEGLFVADVAVC